MMSNYWSRIGGFILGVAAAYLVHDRIGGRHYQTSLGRLDGMTGAIWRDGYVRASLGAPPAPPPPARPVAPQQDPGPTAQSAEAIGREYEQLVRASMDRALKKHHQFSDKKGAPRAALDNYVKHSLATRPETFFDDPTWPEQIVEEYVQAVKRR